MLSSLLILISIVLMALGGWSDYTGQKLWVSRDHYWNDALYLVLLAIYLK